VLPPTQQYQRSASQLLQLWIWAQLVEVWMPQRTNVHPLNVSSLIKRNLKLDFTEPRQVKLWNHPLKEGHSNPSPQAACPRLLCRADFYHQM
jgi:hypothetical protein